MARPRTPQERKEHRAEVLADAEGWLGAIDNVLEDKEADAGETQEPVQPEPKEKPGDSARRRRNRSLALPRRVEQEIDKHDLSIDMETK